MEKKTGETRNEEANMRQVRSESYLVSTGGTADSFSGVFLAEFKAQSGLFCSCTMQTNRHCPIKQDSVFFLGTDISDSELIFFTHQE